MKDMNRNARAAVAQETVTICEAGFYVAPSGRRVNIGEELERAKRETVLYSPEIPPKPQLVIRGAKTRFTVINETTCFALKRLEVSGGHIACLNFASAKNPGGGFLNGSLAQEEALACASGLYPSLLTAPGYYERNRANGSALYLDLAIFSPLVPFIRSDDGELLENPILASVVTAPAPNTGAIARNEPENLHHVQPTLRKRAALVLEIARAHQVDRLVLGAWGCGVFRNEPKFVAEVFGELLNSPGKFAGAFTEVVFAVYDRSEDQITFRAFADRFNGGDL